MRVLGLDYSNRRLAERSTADPVIAASGEILLRVAEVGICGTDRELARFELGNPPEGESFLVIGHEALGQVEQVAPDVTGIREGDWVVPMVRRPCAPPCASCKAGRRDLCVSGRFTERGIFGAHGYFADLAVDAASDVVVIPPACREWAILIEPLSVVEKATATAIRLHAGEPRSALVMGAGAIGLLAAMVLRLRGFEVSIVSRERENSARARLARSIEAEYATRISRKYDVVVEAAGSTQAAQAAAGALAPMGVMIVLGAKSAELPLIEMIVNNQVLAGSVNASPEAFEQAVRDLPHFPRIALDSMIRRLPFSDWPKSIGSPIEYGQPKLVHVMG